MTEEEIKYHNRLWYYKTYNQLIAKCQEMEKDGYPEDMYTEVHHILPKCQGGTNEKCNLVRMPVRYHIIAHMLLASAFPDERGLVFAVIAMSIGIKNEKINRNKFLNSSRLISKFRESYKIILRNSGIITTSGKVIFKSKEVVCFDKDLRVIRLYSPINSVSKDKFNPGSVGKACRSLGIREYANYFWMYREDFEKLYPHELNDFLNSENLPELDTNYGDKSLTEKLKSRKQKPRSIEWRKKISNSNKNKLKNNSNLNNSHRGSERRIISPNKTYNSLKEASMDIGVTEKTLRNWIINNPEKGFKYETERYIIGPDNTIYKSLGDCSKAIGYSKQSISSWIKNHPEKGFRYYTEENND